MKKLYLGIFRTIFELFNELPPTEHTKHFKFLGNFSTLFQKLTILIF